jgi:hypothetical protein
MTARAGEQLAFAFRRLNLNAAGSPILQHPAPDFIRDFDEPA